MDATYTAEQLRECPFCGKRPDLDDQDTLYPSGVGWKWDEELQMRTYHRIGDVPRDQWCWVMHCPTNSGGCGAEVHGDSREEAITKWNRRAHADLLDRKASIDAAQGEDVRGPVERLKEARRIVWSMCADGRPPRMSIPAEDTDEDVFIVDTITATIALLESLSAKLAERDAELAALKAERDTSVAVTERIKVALRIRGTGSYVEWAAHCRDALDKLERAEAELAKLRQNAEAMRGLLIRTMPKLAPADNAEFLVEIQNATCNFRADFPEEK